jgi:hypothetical protein
MMAGVCYNEPAVTERRYSQSPTTATTAKLH